MSESSGRAADEQGNPTVDPTRNVLDLVQAAVLRQDDLRGLSTDHNRELLSLHATHQRELNAKETDRLNAIRRVDVDAVQRAAEVQATQAGILATQVTASAEAMRTQVAAAQTAATEGLSNALEPIIKDIADLRKAQYEAQGVKAQSGEGQNDQRASLNMIIAGSAVVISVLMLIALVVIAITTK